MKKLLWSLALGLVAFVGFSESSEAAEGYPIFIGVDDELVHFPDSQPVVKNSTTYVPVRFVSDAMGSTLERNSEENTLHIQKGEKSIHILVDQKEVVTETGEKQKFDLFWKDGRIMVPLRFIGEHFGYKISYIPTGPIARISSEGATLTGEELYLKHKDSIAEAKQSWVKAPVKAPTKPPVKEEIKKKYDKVAYITFDDGPNKYTPQILDILKKYDAKATFFMMEGNMRYNKNVVIRMGKEGHGYALHGVTHDKKRVYLSPQTLVAEMNKGNQTLKNITGKTTDLIRVPYGSKPYMTQPYRDAVVKAGYKMWDWNVDSNDWRYSKNHQQIVTTVKTQVEKNKKNGSTPIILFHDNAQTVKSLPQIIEYLQQNGYELKPYTKDVKIQMNFWKDSRL